MFTEQIIIITIVLSSNMVPVIAGQPMSTDQTRSETSEMKRRDRRKKSSTSKPSQCKVGAYL